LRRAVLVQRFDDTLITQTQYERLYGGFVPVFGLLKFCSKLSNIKMSRGIFCSKNKIGEKLNFLTNFILHVTKL
jgi:hypothetical protein